MKKRIIIVLGAGLAFSAIAGDYHHKPDYNIVNENTIIERVSDDCEAKGVIEHHYNFGIHKPQISGGWADCEGNNAYSLGGAIRVNKGSWLTGTITREGDQSAYGISGTWVIGGD